MKVLLFLLLFDLVAMESKNEDVIRRTATHVVQGAIRIVRRKLRHFEKKEKAIYFLRHIRLCSEEALNASDDDNKKNVDSGN